MGEPTPVPVTAVLLGGPYDGTERSAPSTGAPARIRVADETGVYERRIVDTDSTRVIYDWRPA